MKWPEQTIEVPTYTHTQSDTQTQRWGEGGLQNSFRIYSAQFFLSIRHRLGGLFLVQANSFLKASFLLFLLWLGLLPLLCGFWQALCWIHEGTQKMECCPQCALSLPFSPSPKPLALASRRECLKRSRGPGEPLLLLPLCVCKYTYAHTCS